LRQRYCCPIRCHAKSQRRLRLLALALLAVRAGFKPSRSRPLRVPHRERWPQTSANTPAMSPTGATLIPAVPLACPRS
jgi:hypothetical protein